RLEAPFATPSQGVENRLEFCSSIVEQVEHVGLAAEGRRKAHREHRPALEAAIEDGLMAEHRACERRIRGRRVARDHCVLCHCGDDRSKWPTSHERDGRVADTDDAVEQWTATLVDDAVEVAAAVGLATAARAHGHGRSVAQSLRAA